MAFSLVLVLDVFIGFYAITVYTVMGFLSLQCFNVQHLEDPIWVER